MKQLIHFLKERNISPKNLKLYELAFTHTSVNVEGNGIGKDYERLEFIGDAFISMVVADLVFKLHPDWPEGLMSKTRAKYVQTDALVTIAQRLNLAQYAIIGPSIQREQVGQSKKILENMFEAFCGAMYIDMGFSKAYQYVSQYFFDLIQQVDSDSLTDYKTRLQEEMQAEYREAVTYELLSEEGPSHEKTFTVRVMFQGLSLGEGKGSSKKQAEQEAAKDALTKKAV
jgi:ribonuclease-3